MITWAPDIVIYHDNCMDGFTAAWACWKRWPDARYVATNYGRTLEQEGIRLDSDLADARILIVDFSYPPADLEKLVTVHRADSVVVLDHHKTALDQFIDTPQPITVVDDLPLSMIECALDAPGRLPIVAILDMERSGAGLAWDFAHGHNRPRLVDLVEDRDLWRFSYGDEARHLHLALSSGEKTFNRWEEVDLGLGSFIEIGASVAVYRDEIVAEIAKRAWTTQIDGKRAVTVDCPYSLVSDVGHYLLTAYPDVDFAALRVASEDAITFSLRSEDARADVSAIARKFGGGGHRNAAGFRVPR